MSDASDRLSIGASIDPASDPASGVSGATHTVIDWARTGRTGQPEAVFASGKTVAQIRDIVAAHAERRAPLLITRLRDDQADELADELADEWGEFGRGIGLAFDRLSHTATLNAVVPAADAPRLGVVTAGTSDLPVAAEAAQTARFLGLHCEVFADLGVAGLWRLLDRLEVLNTFPVLIAVAGMEGALFSVLPGLVRAPVIAVPASVGYGVAAGGQAALSTALATCAPGLVVVNIDNGFGAAMAAARMLRRPSRGVEAAPGAG